MHSEGTGANEGVRDFAFGGRSTVMSAGGLVLESMMSLDEARRNNKQMDLIRGKLSLA